MPFVHSDAALATIEQGLSTERLASYMAMVNGDRGRALRLYEKNLRLSEGVYGMLQGLEVALRNSVHRIMTGDTGMADWYDRPQTLWQPEKDAVAEAKANIAVVPITPGRVVAQLTFGFWIRLLGRNYEKTFWVPHLYKAFPHLRRPDRKSVFDHFDEIRLLRNKVAHHERILGRDLKSDYRKILEGLGWICPTMMTWVNIHNSLHMLIFGKS